MTGVQNRARRSIAPVCALANDESTAHAVMDRVSRMVGSRGGVACVFVRGGFVYVIHGDSPRSDAWMRDRATIWVGSYGAAVTPEMIMDDLHAAAPLTSSGKPAASCA